MKSILRGIACFLLIFALLPADALAARSLKTPAPAPTAIPTPRPYMGHSSDKKPASDAESTQAPKEKSKGTLRITRQPEDCHVKPGGTASFTASAENDTGITWRLVSPDGTEEILVKDVGKHFRGVKVSGKNSDTMQLKKVTEDMHGWQVYCTFGGNNRRLTTELATLYIIGMELPEDEETEGEGGEDWGDEEDDGGAYLYQGTDALTVTAVGATLERGGAAVKSPYDFSDAGTTSFKVTAQGTPSYWVINGARYDFNRVPTSITIRDLGYPMVIEAVRKGGKAETIPSNDALQEKRTGEILLATARAADLCFVRANGNGAGGWFREFDFTDDYVNQATKKKEKGGRVTLRAKAYIPEGKKVSYWEFNDAKLDFSRDVTEFVVTNLNETMEYHPVCEAAPKTPAPTAAPTAAPTPVPNYTITCFDCDFSGGGYTNAKSGTVPAGTKITVTPRYATEGWWVQPYGEDWGDNHAAKAITYTVNKNVEFYWDYVVN